MVSCGLKSMRVTGNVIRVNVRGNIFMDRTIILFVDIKFIKMVCYTKFGVMVHIRLSFVKIFCI